MKPKWEAMAKNDYKFYVQYVHRGLYRPAPHNLLISEELEKIESGENDRLMIFMPPRHGKSMTVTETFPSYFVGRDQHRRIIEISYNNTFAKKFGKKNRDKVRNYGPDIFNVELDPENGGATNWGINNAMGGMLSSGVGGTITGEGADLLLIDDPIKNRAEANSETYRNNLWNEYSDTVRTRVHANGKIILIMTRWHEDDLAGRILYAEPGRWKVLRLPALCEEPEKDPLGRRKGDPLWPQGGYNKAYFEDLRNTMPEQSFAALYQQRPSPEEGNILKRSWWNYYNEMNINRFERVIQSWDCAFKDADDSSFVVGQLWGKIGANIFLIDQTRAHMDFGATVKAIRDFSKRWPEASAKYIEDKANGPAVISTLKNNLPGIIPVQTGSDSKAARAYSTQPYLQAGNVYVPNPRNKPWVDEFIEECAVFPNGAFDDQVDCFTQACNKLFGEPDLRPGKKARGY